MTMFTNSVYSLKDEYSDVIFTFLAYLCQRSFQLWKLKKIEPIVYLYQMSINLI